MEFMKNKIYYVTTNNGKFDEVYGHAQKYAPEIELIKSALDIQEIQSDDQLEIAVDKAKKAWALTGKPLLLDDAAIYFERYHKFPGTLSKFVSQGIKFEGVKRLFDVGDRAYFLLYMIYISGPTDYHVFEGRCDGYLIKPDTSNAHPQLPYDAFFVPDGEQQTYAKLRGMPCGEQYLYRIKALNKFLKWYKQNG